MGVMNSERVDEIDEHCYMTYMFNYRSFSLFNDYTILRYRRFQNMANGLNKVFKL